MEQLAAQSQELLGKVQHLTGEVEKLSLDLGVKQGKTGPGWQKVTQ
jgi:hypothetical protein